MSINEGSYRREEALFVTGLFRFTGLNPRNCHHCGGELLAKDISTTHVLEIPCQVLLMNLDLS